MRNLILLFIIISVAGNAQTIRQFDSLYNSKRYSEAMEMAWAMTKNEKTAAFGYIQIGRYFGERKIYDSSLPFFQKAIELDSDRTFVSGWAHADLGKAYVMTGERGKGVEELKMSVALYKTDNSVKFARHILDSLGLGKPARKDRVVIEREHIVFQFQDTTYLQRFVERYMDENEATYVKLDDVFHAKLPFKLKLCTWSDEELARKNPPHPYGYAEPEKSICNVSAHHAQAHEMTHVLSHWGWGAGPASYNKFINEGIAVAFDMNNNDKFQRARRALRGADFQSILEIWRDEGHAEDGVLYPVGGAFMLYVYQTCSLNQFKALVKHQAIDEARKIFGGDKFDKLIADFNSLMGLKG